jgi:hypothetical protein
MSTMIVPRNRIAIVNEVEVIVMPVDERVNVGKPWFTEDKVIVGEGIGIIAAEQGARNKDSNRGREQEQVEG